MKRQEHGRRRQQFLRFYLLAAFAMTIFCGQGQRAVAQQWTTTGSDINSANTGNVGINTPTPAAKLQVTTSGYSTYTDLLGNLATVGGGMIDQTLSSSGFTNPYRGMVVKTKVDFGTTNLSANVLGLYSEIGVPSTNAASLINLTLRGGNNVAYYGGTGSLGNLQGFYGTVIRNGTGTVTTLTGIQTVIQNKTATGAITDVYGLRIDGLTNVGTITNTYGVHVGDMSAGTQTNTPFSFYASDPNADNYFAGNVGIGMTAPAEKLTVAGGDIKIETVGKGIKFSDGTFQKTAGAPSNTSITVSAGTGLSGGGSLTLGAGGTLTLDNTDKGSDQKFFKHIADSTGVTRISATLNNDAILFEGTGGTTVSFNNTAKKITINSSTASSTISAANVTHGQFGAGDYIFPDDVTVNGNINAKYQDVAEWVPSRQKLSAGTVVILDPEQSNHVISSASAYDTRVAGVVSARPGVILGEGGGGKVLVATTGRVKVKVDATRAPIRIGDLLVTSDVEGVAMKSEPISVGGRQIHAPGTLIGKALEPLDQGAGEILVLLSMQ